MKKIIPLIIVLVVAAGTFLLFSMDNSKDSSTSGTESQETSNAGKSFNPPAACDVFTLEEAKKVLGETAEVPDTVVPPTASSDDISVSQCIYQTPADTLAAIRAQKQASVLVRGAKTETGADSNKDYFSGSTRPAEAEDVSGYGDAATWNAQFGQLNILKNNNWYILQTGSSTPAERTLEQAKSMADAIISKL